MIKPPPPPAWLSAAKRGWWCRVCIRLAFPLTLPFFIPASGCGYYDYAPQVGAALGDAGEAGDTALGSTDAGSDSGPSCAGVTDAIVCTDFDDLAGFTVYESDGVVQITGGVLDTMTFSPAGYASVVATFDPIVDGSLYFRGRMRIVGNFPIVDVNPLMIGNRLDVDYGVDFNLVNGAEFRINPSNGLGANSAGTLPRDTWICLDGGIVLDETMGSAFVRADGVTIVSVTDTDTLPPSGVAHVSLGIDWTSAGQDDAGVQWDDFVLARSPVVCP